MIYREDKYGNPISLLGFGCMRFTKKGRNIDVEKAGEEVMEAVKAGTLKRKQLEENATRVYRMAKKLTEAANG